MSHWWEQNLAGLSPEIAAERRRVLMLVDAHKSHIGQIHVRLMNTISSGLDIEAEMKLPIQERAGGFDWLDA